MAYQINVKDGSERASAVDGNETGYSLVNEGDRAVFTAPDGRKASFASAGLSHVDVSLGEVPVVIAHYSEAKAGQCCVTCNGWTYCGDTACCDMGGGNWLCC
jgi:hypothetical protein